MDWDGIKYIFQIPLNWYRKVDNMIFHAYGSNFLTVREGYYGGLEVGIDMDGFSNAVGQLGYGKVKTVDGKEPDDNGNVSFSLTGGKWLKSDSNGHIVTTNDKPIAIDEEQKGYLYNNEGTLEYKDDEYVTLDTEQIITGEKTFQNTLYISNGTYQYDASILVDSNNDTIFSQNGNLITNFNNLSFNDIVGNGHIDIDPKTGAIDILTNPNSGGGSLFFHQNGAATPSSGIEDTVEDMTIAAIGKPLYLAIENGQNDGGITLTYANNMFHQLLENEPARLYSTGADNQIASRGYCRTNFARATHTHGNISNDGKITASRGATTTDYYVAVDNQGNLFREPTSGFSPDMSNYVTTSALETTLQNYATTTTVSDLTDVVDSINDSYQDANDVSTAISTALQDYVSTSDLNTTLQDYATLSDLDDYVTDEDLDGYVTSVDGHSPVNGAVNFGLAGSKWMKTDASGHVATTDETPIALPSGYTGQSQTFSVVTDVTWNGTILQQKKRQLTFKNGALVTIGGEIPTTIDTPTVITWA